MFVSPLIVGLLLLTQQALEQPFDKEQKKPELSAAKTIQAPASSNQVTSLKHKTKVRGPPGDELTNRLIQWIVSKRSWKIRKPLPKIVKNSSSYLMKKYYGKYYNPKLNPVYAFYVLTTHTIYLLESWDARKLRDRGILLHELIHAMQNLNKAKYDCPELAEWDALELHFAWLKKQGIKNPQKFLEIDDLALLVLASCSE